MTFIYFKYDFVVSVTPNRCYFTFQLLKISKNSYIYLNICIKNVGLIQKLLQ